MKVFLVVYYCVMAFVCSFLGVSCTMVFYESGDGTQLGALILDIAILYMLFFTAWMVQDTGQNRGLI